MKKAASLAVLIDAENVSHRRADSIFEIIGPLGRATVKRIYGDFKGQADSWSEAAARHALDPRHCFAPGNKGADILLASEATELACAAAVEAFCIVSSDGDFSTLARKIRGSGRPAYGIGDTRATRTYRLSFTRFFCLGEVEAVAATPHAALPLIREALRDWGRQGEWINLAEFGTVARKAGIDPRKYGASRLTKLLQATGQFTIDAKRQRFRSETPLRAIAGGT